tara:strand:- start:1363 stop:1848 length:486 start_codon:yes stop_codon:yes gene_type:complete
MTKYSFQGCVLSVEDAQVVYEWAMTKKCVILPIRSQPKLKMYMGCGYVFDVRKVYWEDDVRWDDLGIMNDGLIVYAKRHLRKTLCLLGFVGIVSYYEEGFITPLLYPISPKLNDEILVARALVEMQRGVRGNKDTKRHIANCIHNLDGPRISPYNIVMLTN